MSRVARPTLRRRDWHRTIPKRAEQWAMHTDQIPPAAQPAPRPTGPDPGPGRYREQYGVIVVVPDQQAQERVYEGVERLLGDRFKVRVVTT